MNMGKRHENQMVWVSFWILTVLAVIFSPCSASETQGVERVENSALLGNAVYFDKAVSLNFGKSDPDFIHLHCSSGLLYSIPQVRRNIMYRSDGYTFQNLLGEFFHLLECAKVKEAGMWAWKLRAFYEGLKDFSLTKIFWTVCKDLGFMVESLDIEPGPVEVACFYGDGRVSRRSLEPESLTKLDGLFEEDKVLPDYLAILLNEKVNIHTIRYIS